MGILTRTCNLSSYTTQTDLPEDFLSKIASKIRYHAFREIEQDSVDEKSIGWVDLYNMLDNQFEKISFLKEPYIVLSLRVDTRIVPSTTLKRCCLEAEDTIKKAEGITKLPKKRAAEIKDAVKFKLLKATIPSSKIYDMVWNYLEGCVFFTNVSHKLCDEFQELFYNTFDVRTAITELSVIGSELLEKKNFPEKIVQDFMYIDIAGAEFLTWLWNRASGNGATVGDIDIFFDGRVVLKSDDADSKDSVTCVGDSQSMREIDTALENDKHIVQAKLMMTTESGEWIFTLDALYFDLKSLKPPKITLNSEEDLDGFVYEKIYLLEEIVKTLRTIYMQFVLEYGKQMKGEKHVD